MRGIVSYGAYVPYHRLRREAIAAVVGGTPGRGTRSVASYDEDTTSMGVEAGRLALRSVDRRVDPRACWFATSDPAYLDKTNATTVHAALRLDRDAAAADLGGAPRSGMGAWRAALNGREPTLVVTSDIRTGLPASADERDGGDGAAAVLFGDDADGTVIAEHVASSSTTEEFLDRWRLPGESRSRLWEERFAETRYPPLAEEAWNTALKRAGLTAEQVDRVVLTGVHPRSLRRVARGLGIARDAFVEDLSATVGHTGTAHPGLLLARALDDAAPEQVLAVVSLADGADVEIFRTTGAVASFTPTRTVAAQVDAGSDTLPYGKFTNWRGMLPLEPPRRPLPGRPSAPPSTRAEEWKFAFVGSRDRSTGALHLPPQRVSWQGGAQDEMDPAPMADVAGTIATLTVDKLAYSPSPPIVFAVVDFDGGGRLPVELTDVDADEVEIGDRVEMTFRRLYTADGVHNYFWKARPQRV